MYHSTNLEQHSNQKCITTVGVNGFYVHLFQYAWHYLGRQSAKVSEERSMFAALFHSTMKRALSLAAAAVTTS